MKVSTVLLIIEGGIQRSVQCCCYFRGQYNSQKNTVVNMKGQNDSQYSAVVIVRGQNNRQYSAVVN